jgi:hypothetical protein
MTKRVRSKRKRLPSSTRSLFTFSTWSYDLNLQVDCLEDQDFLAQVAVGPVKKKKRKKAHENWQARKTVSNSTVPTSDWPFELVTYPDELLSNAQLARPANLVIGSPLNYADYSPDHISSRRLVDCKYECQGLVIEPVLDYALQHPQVWHDLIDEDQLRALSLGHLAWASSPPLQAKKDVLPTQEEWDQKQEDWKLEQAMWSIKRALS